MGTCSCCKQRAVECVRCSRGCNLPVYCCRIQCQEKDWHGRHKFACAAVKQKAEEERKQKERAKEEEKRALIEFFKMCRNCGNPDCWKARMYERLVEVTTCEET